MGITKEMLKKIKEEITNDPEKLGYAGKTDQEIINILNSPVIKQEIIENVLPSPINRLLTGLPDSPNTVTLLELNQAKLEQI